MQLESGRDITDIGQICYFSYSLLERGNKVIWIVVCVIRRCSYLAFYGRQVIRK